MTNLIQYFSSPDFFLNERAMQRNNLSRRSVEETASAALLTTGLVAQVYTHDDLRRAGPSSDPYLQLFQNSFYEPRSPHLHVLLKPWVYVSTLAGGTGHGTAYDHDRHVPIAFMGPRIKAGRYATPAGPEDMRPRWQRCSDSTCNRRRTRGCFWKCFEPTDALGSLERSAFAVERTLASHEASADEP